MPQSLRFASWAAAIALGLDAGRAAAQVELPAATELASPSGVIAPSAPYPSTQTPTDSSAAARLQLIADDGQTQISTRRVEVTQLPSTSAPASPPLPPTAMPPLPPTPTPTTRGPATTDPTVPTVELRRLLDGEKDNTPTAGPAIPDVRLKARIVTPGKPPAALIEIGAMEATRSMLTPTPGGPPGHAYGSFRMIHEGDEFSVPHGDSASTLRVTKLTATDVVLEIVNRNLYLKLN